MRMSEKLLKIHGQIATLQLQTNQFYLNQSHIPLADGPIRGPICQAAGFQDGKHTTESVIMTETSWTVLNLSSIPSFSRVGLRL